MTSSGRKKCGLLKNSHPPPKKCGYICKKTIQVPPFAVDWITPNLNQVKDMPQFEYESIPEPIIMKQSYRTRNFLVDVIIIPVIVVMWLAVVCYLVCKKCNKKKAKKDEVVVCQDKTAEKL